MSGPSDDLIRELCEHLEREGWPTYRRAVEELAFYARQWRATALAHTEAADKLQAERDRLRVVLREIADEASDEWAQKIAREALQDV